MEQKEKLSLLCAANQKEPSGALKFASASPGRTGLSHAVS